MKDFSTVRFYKVSYGNFLDNYYVEDYDGFIEYLLTAFQDTLEQKVNLGITDGVTIINNFKGDFAEYNCAIVDRYSNGKYELYKITERQFIRKDLWRLTLVLDVFSKYYSSLKNSQCLINRASMNRKEYNPLLFIEEDMQLSEIKTNQENITLKEKTDNIPFGYLLIFSHNALANSITWTSSGTTGTEITADYTYNTLDDCPMYNKTHVRNLSVRFLGKGTTFSADGLTKTEETTDLIYGYTKPESGDYVALYWEFVSLKIDTSGNVSYTICQEQEWSYSSSESNSTIRESSNLQFGPFSLITSNDWTSGFGKNSDGKLFLDTSVSNMTSGAITQAYKEAYVESIVGGTNYDINNTDYDGKIIYISSTGYYYKITWVAVSSASSSSHEVSSNFLTRLASKIGVSGVYLWANGGNSSYGVRTVSSYNIGYYDFGTPLSGGLKNITYEIDTFSDTLDQPYTVIYIPFNYTQIKDNSKTYIFNSEFAMQFIQDMMTTYGGDSAKVLLDVQLCSVDILELVNYATNDCSTLDLSNCSLKRQTLVNGTNSNDCFTIFAIENCDTIIYNYSITKEVTDFKQEQKKKYILRSPSGSSAYEFSVGKNNGLTGFKIKANIRPYGSMYQVQPIFSGLYGDNYVDDRGLVSLEDTSITMISSAWETYKRNNVNYANSFNANQDYERSQLSLKQKYDRSMFGIRSLENILGTGLGTAGEMLNIRGNYANAGVDASSYATSLGVSAGVGEAGDIGFGIWGLARTQKYERNRLSLSQGEARKQWNFSLGNIQALPNNLDKISGIYNTNTRAFYLETFEPSGEEQTALENYLNLYGCKLGIVYELDLLDNSYLEGQVIIFNGVLTNAEYEELNYEFGNGRRKYTDYDIIEGE